MRLISLKIDEADSCGGILDGLSINFARDPRENNQPLSPLCAIGPNGSGKSQFLQLLAEIFQGAWHTHAPEQERSASNESVKFVLHYDVMDQTRTRVPVRLSRSDKTKPIGSVEMFEESEDGEWISIEAGSSKYGERLPPAVVGYTSGDNETLSLPFFLSRAGYAKDVREAALQKGDDQDTSVPENRMIHVDYATHLEVLIANLLLGGEEVSEALLEHAGLASLASCRCIVQLKPRGGPTGGVKLTQELKRVIDNLQRASTCWNFEPQRETFTFDYLVDGESQEAFKSFFTSARDLYLSLHKLAMLNDLAIPRSTRTKFNKDLENRRFAARLPEPQDESKVFKFERVRLSKEEAGQSYEVDYVSLSDGEHQQSQIFGLFAMLNEPNTLFILDEPESHFNPQWRVQFVKRLLGLPGIRPQQEVILTSHAPFVASDVSRLNVLLFSKCDDGINVRKPDIETYGAPFDQILEHCFEVRPPISALARDDIDRLREEGTIDELKDAMNRLGSSVQKAILADRLRQLESSEPSD